MNAGTRDQAALPVREWRRPPVRAPVWLAILFGVAGVIETIVPYLLLESRLPGQMAWHYGFTGQPNGWASPSLALAVSLLEVVVLSLVFIILQWWVARTPALAETFRGRMAPPLLGVQAVIVVVILPVVSGLLFANAAGVSGIAGLPLGVLFLVIGVGSAVAILLLLGIRGVRQTPSVPALSPTKTHRARFTVGGPIELVCPACGDRYRLDGVPLFAPHLGVGRVGALYLRCPRCGESGWNTVVGRVAA
jgi:hypothetical protein